MKCLGAKHQIHHSSIATGLSGDLNMGVGVLFTSRNANYFQSVWWQIFCRHGPCGMDEPC